MKTLYLIFKEIHVGIKAFFDKHVLLQLYLVIGALAYVTAFLFICIGWYVYEWVTLGHLNQNGDDTITALEWSFLLMLPIVYLFYKRVNKQLNGK